MLLSAQDFIINAEKEKRSELLTEKCTKWLSIKLKNLTELDSVRFGVSLLDKISNALLQTRDARWALYQLVNGKFFISIYTVLTGS